jgi:hypothetical protein
LPAADLSFESAGSSASHGVGRSSVNQSSNLFLDGCCMDLDESRAQSLENKSPDGTVILLSISDDFQQHLGSTFSSVIAFNMILTFRGQRLQTRSFPAVSRFHVHSERKLYLRAQ